MFHGFCPQKTMGAPMQDWDPEHKLTGHWNMYDLMWYRNKTKKSPKSPRMGATSHPQMVGLFLDLLHYGQNVIYPM